ncbi:uracil-xanthine permease family protein [Candidatus Formimonas warabiya]|uniref:Xanthine permease n=1 Tax=Formimonas warabiya TaxID=1761012 RepID=A0A3G1KZ81_FORW1|nr:solute carrier family 23 protein [Candidatus Formimonas warabiya]ATW27836.1 xanthine permease [Candidatus Formimonas warabiya]
MEAKKTALKPSNLIYGLEEMPPWGAMFFLGLQHVFVMSIGIVFPVVVLRAIGGSPEATQAIVSLSMIAGGLGTIFQSLRKGPVGSGYLCPEGPDPSFLAASILAARLGGVQLLFGMTVVAGLFEVFLSRIIYRVRFLFPSEVTGVIVAMVGISVIPLAVSNFMGIGGTDLITSSGELMVALITLMAMIGMNVWGKGQIRMYSVLIGMIVGYFSAMVLGVLTETELVQVSQAAVFSIPFPKVWGFSFRPDLVLPFFIAVICSTLKNVGDITTCQKINDANWKRPDWTSIRGGIFADGLAATVGGFIGGMGQASYSANIGLSVAVGATSRRIAWAAGGIFIFLAFFPKLAAVFTIIPRPVMGAALIFAVSFMILAGIQIIVSRLIDTRKTFIVGISLILGLSAMVPGIYAIVPDWLEPVFDSPLSLATVSVVVLNLILRIGVKKHQSIQLEPGVSNYEEILNFMEKQGAAWGARREVVHRAVMAINESLETIHNFGLSQGKAIVQVSFDEMNLDVELNYEGILMEIPSARPSPEELFADDQAFAKLAGFLVRRYVDGVHAQMKNDRCYVKLHLDH